MHPPALAAPDPHRIARAFLALGDDLAPQRVRRSLVRAVAALAAALALAVAAPLMWAAPAPSKPSDPPPVALGNSKAVPGDDEDDDGAG